MPNGYHRYKTASDIAMSKMWDYPPSQHALPYWKCVLFFCSSLPYIDLPSQELDNHNSKIFTSIHFHVYHLIERFSMHGRRPLDKSKICRLFFCDTASVPPLKFYTRTYIVMMDTSIDDLHKSLYIESIKTYQYTCDMYAL